MLTSMSFLVGSIFRIRGAFAIAPFLTYDPKDVVILFGGFLFGPAAALLMSVAVALLEMVTISDSGPIGALMNALASASFTCTAAFFYAKKRNVQGAIIGLAVGTLVATATMLLLNYLIIPLYAPHITREAVLDIMLPALLPFNLMKSALNAFLAILLYKRVSVALKVAGLYRETEEKKRAKRAVGTGDTCQSRHILSKPDAVSLPQKKSSPLTYKVIMAVAAIAAVGLISAFILMSR